jgi:hypothetical protein
MVGEGDHFESEPPENGGRARLQLERGVVPSDRGLLPPLNRPI